VAHLTPRFILHDGPVPGLRHVTLCTGSFDVSLAFYDAALGALGLVRVHEFGDEEEDEPVLEAAGFGLPDEPASFWLVTGAQATTGLHAAFAARSRAEVDAFYTAALGAGGTPRQPPRRWEIYRAGYFGAVVADPDGNLVEAALDE